MRKLLILCLIVAAGSFVYAQEGVHAGLGFEMNGYDRNNFGVMLAANFSRDLGGPTGHAAVGIKGALGVSPKAITALETLGLFRWYLFPNHWGFFVQPEAGVGYLTEFRDSMTLAIVGLTLGARFYLNGHQYIEPYARTGFPYLWSGGIAFGIRN